MPARSAVQEKYTCLAFKNARAFRRKLLSFGIYKEWERFFAEETDFLSGDLRSHDGVVGTMNAIANMVESNFRGQETWLLGHCLMEMCKLCVAWLHRKHGVCMECSHVVCCAAWLHRKHGVDMECSHVVCTMLPATCNHHTCSNNPSFQ